MLEKTEGAMKNGQSRQTGNFGYTRHRKKTDKTKNTTQKTKKMSNTDLAKNPGAREEQAAPASYKTSAMLFYENSIKTSVKHKIERKERYEIMDDMDSTNTTRP